MKDHFVITALKPIVLKYEAVRALFENEIKTALAEQADANKGPSKSNKSNAKPAIATAPE